jgi:hypothetical protein
MESKLQEEPSVLKREHPALLNMKFLNVFLFCWVIFAFPDPILNSDPDPLTCLNSDTIRIRNTGGDKLTIMYPYLRHTGTLPCMFLFAEIRINDLQTIFVPVYRLHERACATT